MRRVKILVIEDDERLGRALEYDLAQEGYALLTAASAERGLELLKKEGPDVVVADVRMVRMERLQLPEIARKLDPTIQVIIMTDSGSIGVAVEAMRAGAFHYVSRPPLADELKLTIQKALRLKELEGHVALHRDLRARIGQDIIIAESPGMKHILEVVERIAPTETTVLLLGEGGTGKELIARAIHRQSLRRDRPFVAANCATIPKELIESELFGHEKGAFVGAATTRRGRFELAEGGTIFLDEVGDISLNTQTRILRVLEERMFERMGGTETLRADVRILATTKRDLIQAIEAGTFREDLYYRLSVVPIHIPPLRERREDIRPLAQHFLRHLGASPPLIIAPDAFQALETYDWPGNVRELESALERAMIFQRGAVISPNDLPETIRSPRPREAAHLPVSLPEAGLSLEEMEKELIVRALEKHDWNQSRAARYLRITRHTLLYRMEKHNIAPPGSRVGQTKEETDKNAG